MNPNVHPSSGPAVVRINDVATHLGVSVSTVRRLISAGKLRTVRLTSRVVGVTPAELQRILSTGQA